MVTIIFVFRIMDHFARLFGISLWLLRSCGSGYCPRV